MKKNYFLLFTLLLFAIVTNGQITNAITYDFTDNSIIAAKQSPDGKLTLGGDYKYHGVTYGLNLKVNQEINIAVSGSCTIRFLGSAYSGLNMIGTALVSGDLGTQNTKVTADKVGTYDFVYSGAARTLNFKTIAGSGNDTYLPTIQVIPSQSDPGTIVASNGKTDVWDFGAAALDGASYNNQLSVSIINSWYSSSITAGTPGNDLPSFNAGALSWVGGSNDRLRTSNKNLTRYDENIGNAIDYTGRIYVNAGAAPGRYVSLTLSEDDEVTVVASSDGGGMINFQYIADASQNDQLAVPVGVTDLHFVAKKAGVYHIFDSKSKPSYYRILRKDASYVTLTGTIDVNQAAGLPNGYAILFTNEVGKVFTSTISSGSYSVKLPIGYAYKVSLLNANGYIITSGTTLDVKKTTTTHNVVIQKVALYTVTGAITGLGTDVTKLALAYVPAASANKIYVPAPVINTANATYTVQLEPSVEYTIVAKGFNNFYIPVDKITIENAKDAVDVAFSAKSVYNVVINTTGLDANQLSKLALTFSNLNEVDYVYNFNSVSGIALRNGTYSVAYSGLDEYPVEMGLLSNLTINGASNSKAFDFKPVTNWSFDDKVITNGITKAYKGMFFTGTVSNEMDKGHLTAKAGATIKVPVKVGDKVAITYYYSADFTIDGGTPITTASNSTSTFENVEYAYTGSVPGFVTITVGAGAATTYFTNISVGGSNAYKSVITVGTDKEFQTINAALDAISKMTRKSSERVTVMIDPGNYEEMLDITQANITLKNAAATPNIDLVNKGVNINAGAVRITSYYGHGYNYYSMKNNQKWNADILKVNKENGYLTYENKGSGTTNGSYWNATVVVYANGFQADDIIFENSFNQYISKKESEDTVVMWTSGSKGLRPTTMGSTAVQDRPFVERAAAISILNNVDKVILNKCRVVGRQDSFYGGSGSRVVVYKGAVMGAVDYIFGGMTAVFYKTDLAMNTSDNTSDESYLTSAQQGSGNARGYLMFECNVTTAIPGLETASTYRSKPGFFGRPWEATTSEVVFYNTTIETSNFPGSVGKSLIKPLGWQDSLGGKSAKMYEYGTIEKSGENNAALRASWATKLAIPTLTDGTAITALNFTKGSDGWDPLPNLVTNDQLGITDYQKQNSVNVYSFKDTVVIANIKSNTTVSVYGINGSLVKSFKTDVDTNFNLKRGLWIVLVSNNEGKKSVKLMTY